MMATLEHRIRVLEVRRLGRPGGKTGTAACDLTDEELEGVIQMLRDRGEWFASVEEEERAIVMHMSDAELCENLMPLVEEWRASHGHA
jgi:hypothetical protein